MGEKREYAAVVAMLLVDEEETKIKKRKRFWTKKLFLKRDSHSDFQLMRELGDNNPYDFKHYLRMNDECFNLLLSLVKPLIQKQDTRMRNSISAEQRLNATLEFLSTGRAFEDLKFSTQISPQRLGVIIPETCEAIIKVLLPKYMKFPRRKEDWQKVANEFSDAWNFPNCGGAMDGKHIRIVAPPGTGSYFYNYKGYHSVVLMALVNASYEFLMVNVGINGRMSDGGVIEDTEFHNKLINNKLNLPNNSETKEGLNFVFIGDDAFELHEHVLKPFPSRLVSSEAKKIYNYRFSRARRVVENTFGILATRFRIFHTAINLSLWKIDLVAMACCVLHNFLKNVSGEDYTPKGTFDQEDITEGTLTPGEWRNDERAYEGLQQTSRNTSICAEANRDKYLQYFNGTGAVDWQYHMI